MKYHAVIEIDDDRWCKKPFGITIYDENNKQVRCTSNLKERDECYRLSDEYGIPRYEIKVEYY